MKLENKAIGGYFELELPEVKGHYYPEALKYQSARAAFYDLLLHVKPNKVWMPYYICGSMLEPLEKANIETGFYSINLDFSIKDAPLLKEDELLLYVNYFGICTEHQNIILQKFNPQQIIFDHAQAFFEPPKNCLATIYSPRKFFGVPDGGLLITNLPMQEPKERDNNSIDRCTHLLKRLAGEPEDGYKDFQIADESLKDFTPKKMSQLTEKLLLSIDYQTIIEKRNSNFKELHNELAVKNILKINIENINGPMVYPFLIEENSLNIKSKLLENRVFIANYWPDLKDRTPKKYNEIKLLNQLLPLPCDQRYINSDLVIIKKIVDIHAQN